MPKTVIDYSNTIIYKIICKDPAVTDVYVGHTTNFVQRKHSHKQSCISAKSANHNCKLYQVMRNNGGWDNWQMEIINFFKCHDHYEARQKEQEYFISLHATLNSIEPMPKPKPKEVIIKNKVIKQDFYCDVCNTHCHTVSMYEKHNETNKHKKKIKNVSDEITLPKVSDKFICEKFKLLTQNVANRFQCVNCDYSTSKQCDFDKHNMTRKHINNCVYLQNMRAQSQIRYKCDCGKEYLHRQSLNTHKRKCIILYNKIIKEDKEEDILTPTQNIIVSNTTSSNNNIQELSNLLIEVVKNNSDFQTKILDLCKNMQSVIDTINDSFN